MTIRFAMSTASFKASLKKSIITPIFKDFFTCLSMEKIQNQEMPILLINLPFKWFEFPFWSILVLRQLSIVQKSKRIAKHKDLPWTNDLAYNLLISLLGIQNAPYEERQFDLASPTYQLNWEKVKTQHGTKSLSEKIDPHSRFK